EEPVRADAQLSRVQAVEQVAVDSYEEDAVAGEAPDGQVDDADAGHVARRDAVPRASGILNDDRSGLAESDEMDRLVDVDGFDIRARPNEHDPAAWRGVDGGLDRLARLDEAVLAEHRPVGLTSSGRSVDILEGLEAAVAVEPGFGRLEVDALQLDVVQLEGGAHRLVIPLRRIDCVVVGAEEQESCRREKGGRPFD